MKNIIIILFLIISFYSEGQSKYELELLKSTLSSAPKKQTWSFVRSYSNEYDFMFSHLFLFYKNFISSQDANSCSFTPSCSIYAIQAIKKQGVVIGLINFFDRFTRCNSMSPENYLIDKHSHLLIDPVRNFNFEKQ
ncbi:MAG: membrane protein insertion efficiency factor YidD [Chlorobi bacterium]|nr:membrane protein insertion efficiency factor YidD [Chlorobiota bacterium]